MSILFLDAVCPRSIDQFYKMGQDFLGIQYDNPAVNVSFYIQILLSISLIISNWRLIEQTSIL